MQCHICDSEQTFLLDDSFQVYGCKICTHEFSALPPERQETYGPEYFRETHRKWFEHPNLPLFRKINEAVERLAVHGSGSLSFLDIGCGQGDLLRDMKRAGSRAKLSGIDLVRNTDEGTTYYQGDFVSFPFPEQFDAVSGLMVIEHIGDPNGFTRKISSVLKPKGVVIMNAVNASALLYALARVLRSLQVRGPFERLYDKHHLEHYKTRSLRTLFEREGYEVISHRTHNFPLGALDVPEGNKLLALIYRAGIACIFFLTSRGGGVHQTLIARKKA